LCKWCTSGGVITRCSSADRHAMWNEGGDETRRLNPVTHSYPANLFWCIRTLNLRPPYQPLRPITWVPYANLLRRENLKNLQRKYYASLAKLMLCSHHTLSFFILEKRFPRQALPQIRSPPGEAAPSGARPPHRGFTITLRHTTLGRTPLDEGSGRRRDLYLTAHNTYKRQTSMTQEGFEATIPGEQRAANLRLRSRGHRDRQDVKYPCKMSLKFG
jgi:hypothetical protein